MLKGDEYSLQLQCPRLSSNSNTQSSSCFPLLFLRRIRKSAGVGGSCGRGGNVAVLCMRGHRFDLPAEADQELC